jgi:hypothetical protein
MGAKGRNPKSEGRRKAEIRNPNPDAGRSFRISAKPASGPLLCCSVLGFPSDFGLRVSDFSYWDSGFDFVNDAGNHPANGTLIISNSLSGGRAVGRNDHALVHGGAVGINRHLRDAFGIAGPVDGLADDEPPALEARVLAGSRKVAFDTR